MFGSNVYSKSLLGLLVLLLLNACSEVKFADATSKVDTSGIDGTDPGRDPGTDPTGGGTTEPRDPGTDNVGTLNQYSQAVSIANNQVDFLLVIDDSSSMLADQAKLAAKLSGFADRLSQLQVDWQMCVTVTRDQKVAGATGNGYLWGYPVAWSNNPGSVSYIIKKSQNLSTATIDGIVKATINKIGAGAVESGDERGIRAAYYSFVGDSQDPNKTSKNCYRAGAAKSVILISDEDERSVGGDKNRLKRAAGDTDAMAKVIEEHDKPAVLLAKAKSEFGSTVRFTFNSIIVKSNDATCEAIQDAQASPSHAGTFYEEMSRLTNGGITSICEDDYSKNLELFATLLINTQKDFSLKCDPIAASFNVKVSSAAGADITSSVSYVLNGAVISFNKDLVQGTKLEFAYYCKP